MVSADIPNLNALGYTKKSAAEGQTASTIIFTGVATRLQAPYPIFPGKDVAAAGWSKSWFAKASSTKERVCKTNKKARSCRLVYI
jgi:hypothetical protein